MAGERIGNGWGRREKNWDGAATRSEAHATDTQGKAIYGDLPASDTALLLSKRKRGILAVGYLHEISTAVLDAAGRLGGEAAA
jgi:hypothetical protein